MKLGAYELLEEIGKGGMATVYRAHQSTMERDVAIKVIKNSIISDSNALDRFQQEAKVIARLEHPHILPVYDFDGRHEPPYIVMRYLDGGTLKDISKQSLLPLAEVAHVFQQIASALDYAHRKGIIHRDIKPSNIMVDREGNVFVSDLGIARITGALGDGRRGITASGAIVGTPEYMSPEQAMGRGDINHQADIYSLGAMLFELVTGQLPFNSESSMAILLMHLQSPIPSASKINPDLPPEIDDIIERAMAKEADARFNTAGQFAQELFQLAGSLPNGPIQLRKAAESSLGGREQRPLSFTNIAETPSKHSTGSRETPSEQQRQLTVVHVNLADLEELLLELDRENAKKHLAELISYVQLVVEQEGGIIREQTENSVQALWGVFEARENDPEVAINAGLKIRDIAQSFSKKWLADGDTVPVQIGIDTGLVLVQRTDDGTLSSSGQATIYASRIERAAPTGSVMISHDTFRHVIGVFDVIQETPLRVRGRGEPIDVYVVKTMRPRAFRLQTRGVEGIETKMIGRDSELKLLQDALLLCIEDSETQMVTVTAEAGVGKSRLLYEFSRWMDVIEETVIFFEGRATPQTINLPYALIRSILSFRFEILDSDSISVMREKMLKGMQTFLGNDSEEATAFIGQLVGFDFSEYPAVQAVLNNAEVFQRRAEAYLNEFFQSIGKQPSIIELEDIHWADHQSLDLMNKLVSDNRHLPLMIICMARPELHERRAGWGEGQEFHHRLDLKPLSKLDSRRLLREVLQLVDDIPNELRDLIIERADGNPFYVEELVKILIEDGVIVKNTDADSNRWMVKAERLKDLRVPPTLTGVLQARLDTLDPMARLLLGRASVIGRIFWKSGVEFLQEADGFHIQKPEALLEDLRQREMIFLREKSDFAGTDEYVIKHAILRDVIYESLLKRQQREYHKAAAAWLIKASGQRVEEYTGLIAEHYEKAGEMTKAAEYWYNIAQQAFRVSGITEAETTLNHALAILGDDDADSRGMRLQITILLSDIYDTKGDNNRALELLYPALSLARELQDNVKVAFILAQIARIVGMRQGNLEDGYRHLADAEQLARAENAQKELMFILRQFGNLYGDPTTPDKWHDSLVYLEESLQIARDLGDELSMSVTWNSIGNTYTSLEKYSDALVAFDESIQIAKVVGDQRLMAMALGNKANVFAEQGDLSKALQVLHEVLEIQEKIGASTVVIYGNIALFMAGGGYPTNEVEYHAQIALKEILEQGIWPMALGMLFVYGLLYEREGQVLKALEYIGANLAKNNLTAGEIKLYVEPLFERARQKISEEELQAALARGATLDFQTVAKSLLRD